MKICKQEKSDDQSTEESPQEISWGRKRISPFLMEIRLFGVMTI